MDGLLWSRLVQVSGSYLEKHKKIVDALNVFPVPDGDTGTNMSLTMNSAAGVAAQKNEEKQVGLAAKQVAYGALMGARGNSGVILSQIFAGFAKKAESYHELDAHAFAEALTVAVHTAYQAVTNPVEGTILTVSRAASEAAVEAAALPNSNIRTVLEASYERALTTLGKTPEMLPVLKQAGVVDAGGKGFVFILEGMLKYLRGEEIENIVSQNEEADLPKTVEETVKLEDFQGQSLQYQYCTEFILKKKEQDISQDEIRNFISDKGDCVLVVGNPEITKIHIHTNHPGKILDFCTGLGSLHEIQIHNMCEQSEEMQSKARAVKHLGIVSVAMGTGLAEIFKSLGVDIIISGGQTMNPSTQDFLDAIDKILAEEVLILPNNGNVILAAKQAAGAATKPVEVVTTKTIPQGIAALMAYNSQYDITHNKNKMEEASKQIITIEITYAVRDARYNGHNIVKDQILGLVDDELTITGSDIPTVLQEVIKQNLQPNHELMTIYYGEDVKEAEARKVVEELSSKYSALDFELHFGGQSLYYYLISLE